MTHPIRFSSLLRFLLKSTILSLAIAVVGAVTPVQAVQTLPVMVDYLDTAGAGATTPQGVAYITTGPLAGDFAVVDSTADEVFIFDSKGVFKSQFDTATFAGSPLGITYISSGTFAGHLAIVDNVADQIFVVDTSGAIQTQCTTTDFGSGSSTGITFIPSGPFAGKLGVVDSSNDTLFITDFTCTLFTSRFVGTFSATPADVAYDTANDFFAIVDDSTNVVTLIDTDGTFQDDFSVAFVASDAKGIVYLPMTGNYAVVDTSQDEVFAINIESQFLSAFSTSLFGSTSPQGITYISSGPNAANYAIVDDVSDQVYFVAPDGNLIDQCSIADFSGYVRDIAFLPTSGEFAIADIIDNEVYRIDSSCNLLGRFDTATFGIASTSATGIAYSPAFGDLALTDNSSDAVLFVNPARPGRLKSQLSTSAVNSISPSGLTFFPQATGLFAVVDDSADEVLIMNASGSLMGRFDTALVLTASIPSGIAFNPTNQTLAITDNNGDQVKIISFPTLFNFAEFCDCDLNKDGKCNILDWPYFIEDWGRTDCP